MVSPTRRPDLHTRPVLIWLVTVLAAALGLGAIAGTGIPGVTVAILVVLSGAACAISYYNRRGWIRVLSGITAALLMATAVFATAVPFTPNATAFSIVTETNPNLFSESFNPLHQPEGIFLFPGRTTPADLPPPPDPPDPLLRQARHPWAVENGGIDFTEGILQFVLTAQGASVQIIGMSAVVDKSLSLPDGIVVSCDCGDMLPVRHLDITVDTGNIEYVEDSGVPLPMAFTLAPGTAELFSARAWAYHCTCEWHIELSLLVDGERQKARVDDNGTPFRIASTGDLSPRFNYRNGTWSSNSR